MYRPPVDFNLLLEERIHFNTSTTMGFTNIVDTRIIFQEPMRFSTDNILVATMELPAIDFGPGRRYQLNHNFTLELANVTKWESLWKR